VHTVLASTGSLAVLLAAGWFVWGFVRAVRGQLAAEVRLQGVVTVCRVIGGHAHRHPPGAWPRSWDELRTWSSESTDDPIGAWGFAEPIESVVVVDFGADIRTLLKQNERGLDPIRPAAASAQFPTWDYVDGLKRTLRDAQTRP
jgi:hypothetical protein